MEQNNLEQLFIGAILQKTSSIPTISSAVSLTSPMAMSSYQHILALFKADLPVNLQTVAVAAGPMKFAGWLSEASDLGAGENVKYLADEINNRAAKKRIISNLQNIISSLPLNSVDEALNQLKNIYTAELTDGNELGTISEAMAEFDVQVAKYQALGNIGTSTGFTKWDNEYITYEPGHLWGIGGFTSTGKTATSLEMVGRIGKCAGIAIFSMEMTKPQIISRMISRLTGYSSRLILAGKINNTAVFNAKRYLEAQPIHIFRKTRKWDEIAKCCMALKMRSEIDIAVWDYQQNISGVGRSTHDKMEYIARSAQDLVQYLEITGVMLSQISLQQARDDSGNPEFKGGGGLAECCDVAIHLSRPKTSKTELMVEMRKNRHGPKINLLLEYQQHYTMLEEIG